jgi:hypothetical protein
MKIKKNTFLPLLLPIQIQLLEIENPKNPKIASPYYRQSYCGRL